MNDEPDELMTARLLRLAGPRPAVPAERAERIRQAVSAAWREQIGRQRLQRRLLFGSLALAAAAAVVIITRTAIPKHGDPNLPKDQVVTVVRTEGSAGLVSAGGTLAAGEWVETPAASRIALQVGETVSIRVDVSTRMRVLDRTSIQLDRGAVYVDTGLAAGALEVRTPLGVARDIGTQFEVRLDLDSMRVRVRTGLVEMRRSTGTTTIREGTEVMFAGEQAVTRPIAAFGPEWLWASALAPEFDIEGQSLAAFLRHVSREQGWRLRYSDPELAQSAESILLHGSVPGLQAEDAVTVAVRTSNLASRLRDGELVVSRVTAQH
jgi:ferric-dicitrate binding protein FerR (iron transport regulator)